MRDTGGADPQPAFRRAVVVGPGRVHGRRTRVAIEPVAQEDAVTSGRSVAPATDLPDARPVIASADLRGLVARAHGFGLTLVGDLVEPTALMAAASASAPSTDTAYGLVRLSFRRA